MIHQAEVKNSWVSMNMVETPCVFEKHSWPEVEMRHPDTTESLSMITQSHRHMRVSSTIYLNKWGKLNNLVWCIILILSGMKDNREQKSLASQSNEWKRIRAPETVERLAAPMTGGHMLREEEKEKRNYIRREQIDSSVAPREGHWGRRQRKRRKEW